MEENRVLDEKALAQSAYSAGYDLAHAMATMVEAFANGLSDGFAAQANEFAGVELVQDAEPELKTDIRDCRACWCDTCTKLEDCEMCRAGSLPDGLRPLPCIDCVNGIRFMPKEKQPCPDYIEGESCNNG